MKQYNSMYLGMCISNNDPKKRGRVKVFIPHIMPSVYEGWNKEGNDIEISCPGDNMIDGLSTEIVKRLEMILPWAEAASPICGTSAPGNLIANFVQGAKDVVSRVFDLSPEAEPADIKDLQGLYKEAEDWVGDDARGSECKASYSTNRGPGNCLRGTQGILGALTGHPRFNAKKEGGLGTNATLYSSSKGQSFTGTGLYNAPNSLPSNYMSDSSQWKVGDIVAADGGGPSNDGHIQVWTGKAWVSDFTQNRILTENKKGSYGNFTLHRPNAEGEARIAERANSLIGNNSQPKTATSLSGEVAAANVHQSATPINTKEGDNQYGSVANPDVTASSTASLSGQASAVAPNLTNQQKTGIRLFQQNYQKNYGQYKAVSDNLAAKGYKINPEQLAAMHWREGSGSMTKSIANGNSITSYVRKDGLDSAGSSSNSYAPTDNWVDHSTEVIEHKLIQKYGSGAKQKDFTQNAQFYDFAERFNGMGYRQKGVASPYVWSGTDQYSGGKYVKDGVYDPNYRDQQLGVAVLASTASGTPIDVNAADMAGMPMSGGGGGLVNNTDRHGPVVTQNLNNVAKGLFSYPAAGSMLWVFFREGNPLYPVYFAASYSDKEWESAYGLASDGPGYKPEATADNQTTSTGGLMNLNGVGGIRWEDTNNPSDRMLDQKSIMFFGEDGSNVFMGKGYNQYFSKFDRRDQVEGDRWESTLGFKEEWVQGDTNEVVMGDVYVKIGNVSQPAVDAVERIQELIVEIQKPLSET
jgi:lysozyme family protein